MIHNDVEFWRYLESLPKGHPDLPTPRVCRLLQRAFSKWNEKPLWLLEEDVGHLFRNRDDIGSDEKEVLRKKPAIERKGLAIRRMFEVITAPEIAKRAGSFEVDADELVLGTLPPFSVGQGKEFVRYLTDEEELSAMLNYLNELSPMGHIVPDHQRVVSQGLKALMDECEKLREAACDERKPFYTAVLHSLDAIIFLANRYADEAERVAESLDSDDPRRLTLGEAAQRLRRVPSSPAKTFLEAIQSIYLVHCALHWTVEIVPLGRLDQILQPFYERDVKNGVITAQEAQEALDCLWVKLDEKVILNRRFLENRFTACDGVLTGFFGPSNYDQGALLNQWMQQITIGGYRSDNSEVPTDSCNDVTRMCLECARRLPLNSPTLDLRVNASTPADVLELAAKALMSGGAHPVLLNDEKIIAGYQDVCEGKIPLASLRNYACDGCYETMPAGESEFSFGFVSAPEMIEKTLNRGATYAQSGPIHLRGIKESWRSPPAQELESWDDFLLTLAHHTRLACHRYVHNLLMNYGNKVNVAPSPLLSALIGGCIEKGRDLSDGGARYHIFSPLLTGISTAADSLYAIKSLVYDRKVVSLEELASVLMSNWGKNLINTQDGALPAIGPVVSDRRLEEIRIMCNSCEKFGFGNREVDSLGWWLINQFCDNVQEVWRSELHASARRDLRKRYSTDKNEFEIFLVPGVGTFEQYVFGGTFLGASADGRSSGDPIASDISPAPVHRDIEPIVDLASGRHVRVGDLSASFESYADICMNRLGDGAPADYNLPEDFPIEHLCSLLERFAKGEGGSVATFTVADPNTFRAAQQRPSEYNLLRVRMGGWSEFFVCLFPEHQEQHRRRPLFTLGEKST